MVNLLGDWEEIERYTRQLSSIAKIGSYQLKKSKEGIEIKVHVGQFGYIATFKQAEDAELIKILVFCENEGFYRVQRGILDALFFAEPVRDQL